MSAYSMDLRLRVLADCDVGLPTKQVALKYSVSRTWVRWLKQRRRETGSIEPGRPTGRPRKIDRDKLAALVQQFPDATLVELRDKLGIECTPTAIWMALHAMRITFKKNAAGRRARSPGCCGKTHAMAGVASRTGSAAARVYR